MVALWILLGVLALICLTLSSPVSLHFHSETGGPLTLCLRVWGIPFRLLPRPEPETTEAEPVIADTEKRKKKSPLLRELQTTFEEDGVSATLHWLGQLAGMARRAAGRLLRAVTVKRLLIQLRVSGEDAAEVAMHYGETCAALYPTIAGLSALIKVKSNEVTVTPDFLSEGMAYVVDIGARISLWRLAGAAIGFLWDMNKLDLLTPDTEKEKSERTV